MKCHYETLKVSPTATIAQIKKAFREQSLKSHPDLVKGNEERFKQISEAHQILSNPKSRRQYDRDKAGFFAPTNGRTPSSTQKQKPGYENSRHAGWGYKGMFRPRNLALATLAGVCTMSLVLKLNVIPINKDDEKKIQREHARRNGATPLVEAWKNPITGHWEQPAPWDPAYQRLKPTLHMMPREEVRRR